MSSLLVFLLPCYKLCAFVDLQLGLLCPVCTHKNQNLVLIYFSIAFLQQCCFNLDLVLMLISKNVCLLKICIKSKANLESI